MLQTPRPPQTNAGAYSTKNKLKSHFHHTTASLTPKQKKNFGISSRCDCVSVSISQSIVFPLIWPASPPARAHARNGYDGKPYHAIRTQNPPICRTGGAAPTKTLPIHKHTVWILLNHLCVLSHTHAAREHRALGKEHSTQRTEPEATNILSRSCEKVSSDKYRARKVGSRPLFFVTIRPSAPPFRLPN